MITPENFKQRKDEKYFEWKLRLLLAKLNRETDLDWIEIRDILGETCSSDHLRKTAYGMKEFQDYLNENKKNDITDQNILDELEMKRIELEEERVKLQTIRVDYNRIRREKSRKDLMYEMIKDSIETLPVPEFLPLSQVHVGKDREGVLAFGDAHWGKVSESLNNSYSPEIFEERMQKLMAETVYYLKEKEGLTHVTVLNLADSIEGMSLRISQLQTLRTGFIDQTIAFGKFMAGWLNELSKYFTVTYKHVPSANHSEIRPFSSSRGEFPAEDLEKVIINYIHDVLENNPRVEVPVYTENVIDFKLAGYEHAATHGHAFKINKNTVRDLSMQRQKFYQYLWVAHFHHSDVVTVNENDKGNVEMIQVPSIMGSDSYSDSLMTGAKAGAVINIFEEGKGRTTQYNIILN